MTPYLQDADVTLWHGDVLDVLRELPSESVDCVVTSPPYWGLRDYGTGGWEGGNDECDHVASSYAREVVIAAGCQDGREVCGKCGALRVDQQIGLEPTPDEYVARLVEVFREVRRVLASHGTCWVNLGDSYAANNTGGSGAQHRLDPAHTPNAWANHRESSRQGVSIRKHPFKPKDLVGIPWRVAFALQADGWWLRSDIVWAKPNPMPESVTDRPTKAHEYVFLLTKQPRYWFDQEAVREPHTPDGRHKTVHDHLTDRSHPNYDNVGNGNERWPNSGRNVRSVWTIATQPYPEAHFATYPEELVRRCVLAGCPERVCRTCGKASERIVERTPYDPPNAGPGERFVDQSRGDKTRKLNGADYNRQVRVLGESWSDCGHNDWRPGRVLDPFVGSGTTCKVARDHGRHSIGIDLSADYLALAARRLQQQSLFSEAG